MLPLLDKLKGKVRRDEGPFNDRDGEVSETIRGSGPGGPDVEGETVNRYGLSEVAAAGPSDTIDVICVHGLTGHPRKTWTKQDQGFFWPAHIHEDLPHVRVLTFGYDADPTSFLGRANQSRLGEHAQDLLNDAARKREKTETEDRPIIWIAHSLGGLVVEKALTIGDASSENDRHLKEIANKTIGIITLGTPHAGSDRATWPEITSRLLRSVHVNKPIVELLTADSEVLRDTNNAFAQFLETRKERNSRIDIKPFHETLTISNIGMVVSIASASIPGYQSEGIHANHMDMTKFHSREDPGYEKVIGTVRRWQKKWQSSVHDLREKERQKILQACLDSLSYDEVETYHDQSHSLLGEASARKFRHRSTTAFTGTFDWIFLDTTLGFTAWLLRPQGTYWIQGTPGSGKSTLIRHIVGGDSLSAILEGTEIVTAVHYFQASSSDLARSVEGMLRSLLWQMIQQAPFVALRTVLERHTRIRETSRRTWSKDELEISLIEVIKLFPESATCLFIDGLDEHKGEDIDITDYLANLQNILPSSARLCISSRPYPDFAAEFGSSTGFKMHERTARDIEQYVQHRCEDLKTFQPGRVQQLSRDIIGKAQGSFLWCRLVCDDLQKDWRRHRSFEALAKRLEITPKGLLPFYQRILDEIDEQETKEMYHVLSVVAESTMPLTATEILYAMDEDHNLQSLECARNHDWTSFDKLIRTAVYDDQATFETAVDWIPRAKRKEWVSYMYARMVQMIIRKNGEPPKPLSKVAGGGLAQVFEDLVTTAVRSGRLPEIAVDAAYMAEDLWLTEWSNTVLENQEGLMAVKEDLERSILDTPDLRPYIEHCHRRLESYPAFVWSAESDHDRTHQLIRRWYVNKVELIGRGFLAVDAWSGEVRMAHETMLAFWKDSPMNKSEGKGHELLLTAHASALVAIMRQYPAAIRTKHLDLSDPHLRSHRGDVAALFSDTEVVCEHAFQRLAWPEFSSRLWSTDWRYRPFYNGRFDTRDGATGLISCVRQFEAHFDTMTLPTPQYLILLPLYHWLTTLYEKHWGRMSCDERVLVGQLSPRSLLLGFLILAGCHRSACAFMGTVDTTGKPNTCIAIDGIAPMISTSTQHRLKMRIKADNIDQEPLQIPYNVNESGGYLLWLASHYDNADILAGLHKLGAQLNTKLPLAWNAIYWSIENDNTNFVRQFLQLYCYSKVDMRFQDQEILARRRNYVDETGWALRTSQDQEILEPTRDYVDEMGWASQDPQTTIRDLDFQTCRRIMSSFGLHMELASEPSLLTFACVHGTIDAAALLLWNYTAWQDLYGPNGSALVDAVWCNKPKMIRMLLQLKSADGKPCHGRDVLYAALLMSIHIGNGDAVDILLEAGATVEIPAESTSTSKGRMKFRTVDITVSPLHVALNCFRGRDVQVSRRIVLSLKAHGTVLYSQVKDAFHEWITMGSLEDEDCTWLRQLFPDYISGPPDVVAPLANQPGVVVEPQYVWQGDDSDEAMSFDGFSSGSSGSESACSFVSAREEQDE